MEKNKQNTKILDGWDIRDFDGVALDIHRFLQIENREMITKGYIQIDIRQSLRVYIRSNDHAPAHFHIESRQRNFYQKFSIETLENLSKNIDSKFDVYIRKYFLKNSDKLKFIREEFYKLNPHLL